jgi:hypothetical protein
MLAITNITNGVLNGDGSVTAAVTMAGSLDAEIQLISWAIGEINASPTPLNVSAFAAAFEAQAAKLGVTLPPGFLTPAPTPPAGPTGA